MELFNNILSATDKILDFLDCVVVIEDFNLFYRPDVLDDRIVRRIGCDNTGSAVRFSGADINGGASFQSSGQGANSRAAAPRYADPTAGDFRPGPLSPAIDMGWSLVAPSVDMDGTARPQGSGIDVGAYELSVPSARLSVYKAGTGVGIVTSNPLGITCGTECSVTLSLETVVTLTATPVGGSTFTGWSGAGCGGTNTCTATLTADTVVTATFAPPVKDLVIVGLTISPGSVAAGDAVTVSYGSKNQGTASVTEIFAERIYLSENPTLEPGDTLLGTGPGHTSALGPNAPSAHPSGDVSERHHTGELLHPGAGRRLWRGVGGQ